MKKITIVLDGAADRPSEKLGGKTPLEYADTPNLDALFQKSTAGVVQTIPNGLEVGSAVANLSLLGFDPSAYRGRAVIEAAGLGMPIGEDDLYIRVNMVAFEGGAFESCRIESYSAFDIPTEQARPIAEAVAKAVFRPPYELRYVGSFRNILVVKGGKKLYPLDFMPAHDIIGRPIAPFIQTAGRQEPFFDLMKRSYEFMTGQGSPANGLWFWGDSVMPELTGDAAGRAALSETLLMDGITKITRIPNIGTEREGRSFADFLEEKLEKSLCAVREYETIYIHVQEPDDLSHERMPPEKAEALAAFDRVFLPRFLEGVPGDFTLKMASDHFTFSDTGGHGGAPVPFLFYDSARPQNRPGRFTERDCAETGVSLSAVELGQW